MKNTFDDKLPKTTTYWIEGEIFFIKNTNFFVTLEEGKAMAELLIFAMQEKSTKAVVIDNREAKGAWPKEISQIWETDSRYINVISNKKMATLTNSAIKTLQTNRLSMEHGLATSSKAFNSDFNEEVKAFLFG
ncbi:hypothetical protein [Fervidibacillus albus]|uniref:Uncharacterized protein n=1 Tax=Fervidibacillus albus TaxID=2980026 RepID=A0A9E8LSJ8_9BACI|nr:hypothetical protein [Fervidibacillus albus]WAA08815.1 hypothetical protein OE104_09345 [Fervidibacillus albus]